MKKMSALCVLGMILCLNSVSNFSVTTPFLEGFKKGAEGAISYSPLSLFSYVTWGLKPPLAAGLHGLNNMIDQVIDPAQCINDEAVADDDGHLNDAYSGGYIVGNVLNILVHLAPSVLINLWRMKLYAVSPHEMDVEAEAVGTVLRSQTVWGLRALFIPLIVYLLAAKI